jgi:membrane protease YdiL (CAAX protease family)
MYLAAGTCSEVHVALSPETQGLTIRRLIDSPEGRILTRKVTMVTSALAQSASNRYLQAAGPVHTIVVLAVLGGWAFYGRILADHLSAAANPNRVRFYVLTLFFEWLLFVLVVSGVRHSGAPVRMVLGDQWRSVRQVLRDIGIAAAFWIVSAGILFVLGWLLRVAALGRKMDFILPHGGTEITLWIALSVTAGICEETIFRGYLQRQFTALTKSAPAGILLSAAAFGAAHAYQGFRMVILIGLYGAMFGILAYWRGSVRPGIIAHAWNDSLNGVLVGLSRQ